MLVSLGADGRYGKEEYGKSDARHALQAGRARTAPPAESHFVILYLILLCYNLG